MANTQQIRMIHALLSRLQLLDAEKKAELVMQFTDGRETSTAKMSEAEADELLAALRKQAAGVAYKPADPVADKMRKAILHYAHCMAWELPSGAVDMERVNNWCVKFGAYKKKLDAHSRQELHVLLRQFEKAYKHFLKSV